MFDEQDLKMIDDKSDSDEQIDDDIQDPYLKIKLQANLILRNLFWIIYQDITKFPRIRHFII